MALVAIGLAQTAGGHSALRKLGLVSKPQRYTELYFAQPGNLPVRVAHAPLQVGFVIHNAEGSARSYRWSATAEATGKTRTVGQGEAPVATGDTVSLDPALSIPCTGSKVLVTIRLAQPAESISFRTTCGVPAAGRSGQ